ncbi:MAG: GTP-binding protein, partial [Anaerolineae bacterium]|nr:GTP-binding protein [Anaerolineae bacterium]
METLSKKICMLGDFAVGKTSLVRRFVYDMFDDSYISTIGVKVSRKPLVVVSDDRAVDLTMMLWDLAG